MEQREYRFTFQEFASAAELHEPDARLLKEAQDATRNAYAPYSHFQVGAAALLSNGIIVKGTNQENASYPAGLCAERVLLSAVSSAYPAESIESMAISYSREEGASDRPISPCGICRQTLQEYEYRLNHPIRLILGGLTGPVYILTAATALLPLAFTRDELKS